MLGELPYLEEVALLKHEECHIKNRHHLTTKNMSESNKIAIEIHADNYASVLVGKDIMYNLILNISYNISKKRMELGIVNSLDEENKRIMSSTLIKARLKNLRNTTEGQ